MSHVGEKPSKSGPGAANGWLAVFEGTLEDHRARARKVISDHRQHIRQLAAKLDDQIRKLERDLRSVEDHASPDVDSQIEHLAGLKQELKACQAQWQELQNSAGQQQQEFLEQLRREQDRLGSVRSELEKQQHELAERTERWQKTNDQRETDGQAAAGELQQIRSENEQLRQQLSDRRDSDESLTRELDQMRQQRDELKAELASQPSSGQDHSQRLDELRNERDDLRQQIMAQVESKVSLSHELQQVREDRDALRSELLEAKKRIASAAEVEDQSDEISALWQRIELAMEEIRELRDKNDDLEQQLAKTSRESSPSQESIYSSNLDWESQKRILLSHLDSDGESDDEQDQQERLGIEETIRVTNHAIAEKDREIDELRSLLTQQSNNIGEVAVGAAAIEEAFTQDELIQQERKNLREMQEEWHDKLRNAEIEISTERAKLARDRIELEEKMRTIEQSRPAPDDSDGVNNAKQAARRGWLSRLGLSESDE